MHTGILLPLALLIYLQGYAQTTGTTAPVSTELTFQQTYKLSKKVSADAGYALLQKWVSKKPDRFCRQNRDSIGYTCKHKNRPRVEEEFSNRNPLQSIDPSARKVSVRTVLKYGGDESNCINVLFVEYYLILEVKAGKLTATINKFKYHHFDRKTFAAKPIYSWAGNKPADDVGTLEYLNTTMGNTKDVQGLMAYIKADAGKLFAELKSYLSANKALG